MRIAERHSNLIDYDGQLFCFVKIGIKIIFAHRKKIKKLFFFVVCLHVLSFKTKNFLS